MFQMHQSAQQNMNKSRVFEDELLAQSPFHKISQHVDQSIHQTQQREEQMSKGYNTEELLRDSESETELHQEV